jgi:hypothetical protein
MTSSGVHYLRLAVLGGLLPFVAFGILLAVILRSISLLVGARLLLEVHWGPTRHATAHATHATTAHAAEHRLQSTHVHAAALSATATHCGHQLRHHLSGERSNPGTY